MLNVVIEEITEKKMWNFQLSLGKLRRAVMTFCVLFHKMQNPEPSVEFDTVANTKQQHEVNVGKILNHTSQWHLQFKSYINLGSHIDSFCKFHFSAISNSFGFGGHNSVVAFSAFKPWSSSSSLFPEIRDLNNQICSFFRVKCQLGFEDESFS